MGEAHGDERSALQERAGSEMARALGHLVEGEGWKELKHIAPEQRDPFRGEADFHRKAILMSCIS